MVSLGVSEVYGRAPPNSTCNVFLLATLNNSPDALIEWQTYWFDITRSIPTFPRQDGRLLATIGEDCALKLFEARVGLA